VAWLTPDSIPEDDDCRPLSIPADGYWLALFGGALTELTQKWNWQQFGALTVDETVAKMQQIIDAWYTTPCGSDCVLPGGGKIIRIGADGNFEELGDDGEWREPTGDYTIPPITPREGGTPDDQICLAAANAASVLEQFYEQLSDDFAEGVSVAEAITNLIASIAAIIAAPFGLLAEAVLAIATIIFNELYAAIAFITADLWDENFTEQLTCISARAPAMKTAW